MLLARVIELIAPDECLRCGREGALACAPCLDRLVVARAAVCWRCGRLAPDGRTCPACRRASALSDVTVAGYYEGLLKELILALKFERRATAANVLGGLIVGSLPCRPFDLVTFVPAVPLRRRRRGYNQAELLAQQIAQALSLPRSPTLARRGSGRQVGSGRGERFRQVEGAFVSGPADLRGTSLLLIDDVMTTGATLNECARVLREAGAESVWGAVAARH